MLKLIQLEYQKAQLKGILLASVITTIVLIMWSVWSQGGHPKGYPDYATAFAEISFYTNAAILVVSAVLISKLVLDEYHKRTITVLFVYPHTRSRIFVAKLVLLSLFAFALSWLVNLIVSGVFLFFAPANLGVVSTDLLVKAILYSFLFAIATVGINLVSFFFAMWKKSIPAAILPSFLISLLLSSRFYQLDSITSVLFMTLGWFVLGVVLAYWAVKREVQSDVN